MMDRVVAQFDQVTEVPTSAVGVAAWTARDPGCEKQVLIKRLPDNGTKARATIALSLRHPNACSTLSWLRDSGHLYVVREYVRGSNLAQVLSDPAERTFGRLRALLDPVLDALDQSHAAGLSHGRVVPENVVVTPADTPVLTDFATGGTTRHPSSPAIPKEYLDSHNLPTPRADFYSLCALYMEFLPLVAADDEAAVAARARLLRTLASAQQNCGSSDELRYKLEAITKMAGLLGFTSGEPVVEDLPTRKGARLLCSLVPTTAILAPGATTSVTLALDNEGDIPLNVETVGTDVVWLNYQTRFAPFSLRPDMGRDLTFTLSGARLQPGSYSANLIVRSNHGLLTPRPAENDAWTEQSITLPVIVTGIPAPTNPPPLAERLPEPKATKPAARPAVVNSAPEYPTVNMFQEPDPGKIEQGQNGVLHIAVTNSGKQRLRLDRVSVSLSWLSYPGEFKPVNVEPGSTQMLGFSATTASFAGGDYQAEITFVTSALTETLAGPQPIWREFRQVVHVRVVPRIVDGQPPPVEASGAGCATTVIGASAILAVILDLAHHHL